MGDIRNIFSPANCRPAARSATGKPTRTWFLPAALLLVLFGAKASVASQDSAIETRDRATAIPAELVERESQPGKLRSLSIGADSSEQETPVSMSPDAAAPAKDRTGPDSNPGLTSGPPLTRAASKQRIDKMNPLEWLEHFGSVQVGRTE